MIYVFALIVMAALLGFLLFTYLAGQPSKRVRNQTKGKVWTGSEWIQDRRVRSRDRRLGYERRQTIRLTPDRRSGAERRHTPGVLINGNQT